MEVKQYNAQCGKTLRLEKAIKDLKAKGLLVIKASEKLKQDTK